jgi:hypothetical protein
VRPPLLHTVLCNDGPQITGLSALFVGECPQLVQWYGEVDRLSTAPPLHRRARRLKRTNYDAIPINLLTMYSLASIGTVHASDTCALVDCYLIRLTSLLALHGHEHPRQRGTACTCQASILG